MTQAAEHIPPKPFNSLVSCGRPCNETTPTTPTHRYHSITTLTFSTPLSTRILDGHRPPCSSTAVKNSCSTVSERLLDLHFKNIICLEKPSIQPWTTICQRIKE